MSSSRSAANPEAHREGLEAAFSLPFRDSGSETGNCTNALMEKLESIEQTESVSESLPLTRSVEMRASFYQTLLSYIQQVTRTEVNSEVPRTVRAELATVLEGFARVLRDEPSDAIDVQALEIEELRRSLDENKDKIIGLLDERTKDQVHIARLETELKFLPDLQAQADRALSIVNDAGSLQEELSKLRFELNNAHLQRIRNKLQTNQRPRSFWSHVKAHFTREQLD